MIDHHLRAAVRLSLEILHINLTKMNLEERLALRQHVVRFVGEYALSSGVVLDPRWILTALDQELEARARRCY